MLKICANLFPFYHYRNNNPMFSYNTYYQQLSIFIGFFECLKCLNMCCRKLSLRLLSCEQYGHLNFSFGGKYWHSNFLCRSSPFFDAYDLKQYTHVCLGSVYQPVSGNRKKCKSFGKKFIKLHTWKPKSKFNVLKKLTCKLLKLF